MRVDAHRSRVVSRGHSHTSLQYHQERSRQAQARANPAPIATRYQCPVCGGEHDRRSHDAPGCFGLTADQLRELRASAVEELVNAVRSHAEQDHIDGVIAVLDVVDARLAAP
jgi:hypothetical protein